MSRAILEVVELELSERIQQTVSASVGANATEGLSELAQLLTLADKNADGSLDVAELYELLVGAPIEPTVLEAL